MVEAVQIGLIGLGTIGKGLARAIAEGQAGYTSLAAVLLRPHHLAEGQNFLAAVGLAPLVTTNADDFFAVNTALIVEAAGQAAVKAYAAQALTAQKDLLVCAIGALADSALCEELQRLAQAHGQRLLLPSGAIAGIDALAAAALAGLDEVTITTRKPPKAWRGTPAEQITDLSLITDEPYCLFDGTAREAARLFPQNINVAATLALAGLGLDKTRARIYADPNVARNIHEISVRGACVELKIEVCGLPSPDNPKSSALTAYSVIRTIRNLTAPVVIG